LIQVFCVGILLKYDNIIIRDDTGLWQLSVLLIIYLNY